MALIKFSSIGITTASGKASGSVYSHNRSGAYVRNFVVPTNPDTVAQAARRATFGGLSASWRALTQAQRDAWTGATDDYIRKNRLGDQRKLSGIALFISLNQNRSLASQPMLETPLSPQGVAIPGLLNAVTFNLEAGVLALATANLNYELPEGTAIEDFIVLIEATPVVSAGVSYVKNRYRLISQEAAATQPQTLDFRDGYEDVFGNPAVGGKVFIRVKMLNRNTGEVSPYISASGIVTETP